MEAETPDLSRQEQVLVVRACNPSTREVEAGGRGC